MNKKFISILSIIALLTVGCEKTNSSDSNQTPSSTVTESASDHSESASELPVNGLKDLIASSLPNEISGDFSIDVPSSYEGATITFTSSNNAVLDQNGVYHKPENDTEVTLTITILYQNEEATLTHKLVVKGYTVDEKVAAIKDELVLESTEVTTNFTLPNSSLYGASVTWSSSNTDYIVIENNQALVTRPIETFEDEEVVLTASISLNQKVYEKEITVKVLALKVKEISIVTLPSVTAYPLNAANIDVSGGKLHVVLDNDESKDIDMQNTMVKSFDTSSVGNKEVVLSYQGVDTTFAIAVYQPASSTNLALNETKKEDFENALYPALAYDCAQTPNSGIVKENTLNGNASLYMESDGAFKTLYLKDFVAFKANESYQITFNYKVLEMQDTIYFQIAGPNVFTQFGDANHLNETLSFSWIYSSSSDADLIQIFPGSASGKTRLILDDITIKHIVTENNVAKDTLAVGEYVLETFGDASNPVISLDTAPAPASKVVVENGISGASFQLESEGSFGGAYLKPQSGLLVENATYKVSFDYEVLSFVDTIYFQYYNFGAATFTQFGSPDHLNEVFHFEYEVTITDPACIFHVFPGGGSGTTKVLIDNFKIERTA